MKTKLLLTLTALLPLATMIRAQGTTFTYQGRLDNNGAVAHGSYDLRFAIFDALAGGSQIGSVQTTNAVAVSNGLFTVTLDPGAGVFTGQERWLEIAVKTNGAALFTTLSPRQQLTATPYAIYAGGVTASGINGTIAPANIGAGSLTTGMLAAGAVGANQLAAGAVTTAALADGAVTAPKLATVTNWYGLMITNPTPAVGDSFGWSLAAVGSDRVLVGAYGDGTGATNAGAAYLFNTNGTLLTTFTNPTPAASDVFGYAVAAVGSDRVLIGAYGDDTGATNAGTAYLFSTSGTLLTTFTNPTPTPWDVFGWAVAAVGSDRVLISAFGDSTGAPAAGAAYLFNVNGTLLTTFTNPTPVLDDEFGISVAAVGSDRVLIGAMRDDTGAPDAGAAYLFRTNGTLLTTFTNSTPASSNWFGRSVAALGSDRVIIGAPGDNTGASDAGAAYLFRTNGTLLTTFTNPNPASSDWFGFSVAAVGSDRVLIGMRPDETGGTKAGAAYLFSTNGTLLTTFTNPIPTGGGQFGNAVAAVGSDRVLIGARRDDTGATDAGVAYLFSVETYTPGLVADGVRHGSITTASLADGAVTTAKIGGVLLASQIPDLDAAKITGGTLPAAALGNAWKTGGNAGTTPGANFLGTTDNQPLEFKVNNQRGLRLEPAGSNSVNVIGGWLGNRVAPGVVGATVGGGGAGDWFGSAYTNRVEAAFSTVSGGAQNTIQVGAYDATIGGGFQNTIESNSIFATIGGGGDNTIQTNTRYATIGGGRGNTIQPNAPYATIGGGYYNTIQTNTLYATIGGGRGNTIQDNAADTTIGGGQANLIKTYADRSSIGGGGNNTIVGSETLPVYGTIGGGFQNIIQTNTSYSTIGGGRGNTIRTNALYATIPGGLANSATNYAFAAGSRAKANHAGTFVWADSAGGDFASTGSNQFLIRATGNVGINKTNPAATLDVNGGVRARGGPPGPFGVNNNGYAFSGNGGDDDGGMFSSANGQVEFYGNSLERMRITDTGNVGIGTTAPASALHVNGTVTATDFSGNGAGLTNVTALTVGGLSSSNLWKTTGNAGTTAGANFLGTTDDEPLEFWVHGLRALRLEPKGASAPNLIGGAPNNLAGAAAVGVMIGGGSFNTAAGDHAVVGGGVHNTSGDEGCTVGGGDYNTAGAGKSTVGGGSHNNALSLYSTVSGGYENTSGPYATVPGGHLNSAGGAFGFAAGRRAKADHVGAFVWGDSTDANFASTANDQFSVRAAGGVRFTSGSGAADQTVAWVPGSASWTFSSDRNLKEGVQAVDAQSVLEKVARLPVAQWNYIGYPQQHIGPMAQDFHALFPLNDSETTLNDADLHGVALAAIQGLNEKVEVRSQKAEVSIQKLQMENVELKRELTEIKQLLLQLAAKRN